MGSFLRGVGLGAPVAFLSVLSLLRLMPDSGSGDAGDVEEAGDAPAEGADPVVDAAADAATVEPPAEAEPANTGGVSNQELASLRETLAAQEGVIPEMIGGSSVAELTASVEAARAAYQRVADQVNAAAVVPGGGQGRDMPAGWEDLSGEAKIALALKRQG